MRNCLVILSAALLAAGCTEKLGSGRACPDLCPIDELGIADTTINGVVVDSTVFTGPQVGTESRLLLATRVDGEVDLRAVIRFDTLPDTFSRDSSGTFVTDTIRALSRAQLIVIGDSVGSELLPDDSITIAAYDVDTVGVVDTLVDPVASLFVPQRLLGRGRFAAGVAADTMRITLSDSMLFERARNHRQLRIGLRLESGGNTTVRLGATGSDHPAFLRFRASHTADTSQAKAEFERWAPSSRTPAENLSLAGYLADYTLVVKGNPRPPVDGTGHQTQFAVGGVPGRRAYLAFDVPRRLLDSTQIVRATLRLTQVGAPLAMPRDTARLQVLIGTARAVVSDVAKRALFHEPVAFDSDGRLTGTLTGLREVRLKTDTNATRTIEIAPILRRWAGIDSTSTPYTVILALPTEGVELTELRFASMAAPVAAMRPSLQITFVPRNAPGIP